MNIRLTALVLATATAFGCSIDAFAQTVITQSTGTSGMAGDPAGWPITITLSGSYKLGTNLTPTAGSDAIDISVPGVTIDLAGFTISGNNTCTAGSTNGATCVGGSHGTGIASTAAQTTIQNGNINGFTTGISLSQQMNSVSHITLTKNAVAIDASHGVGSIFEHIVASVNGDGLVGGSSDQVFASTFLSNGNSGLSGALIDARDIISIANSSYGIDAGNGGIITNANLIYNGVGGYNSTDQAILSHVMVNGSPVGISVSPGKAIVEDSSVNDATTGFVLGSAGCYWQIGGLANTTNVSGGTALTGTSTTCF